LRTPDIILAVWDVFHHNRKGLGISEIEASGGVDVSSQMDTIGNRDQDILLDPHSEILILDNGRTDAAWLW
jgi:hypothetical protein